MVVRVNHRTNARFEFHKLSDDVLLDVDEVADILSLSRHTVKAWRRDGKGPPVTKVRRAVRFRVRDLRSWLLDQQKTA